jgi:hypothetical protein
VQKPFQGDVFCLGCADCCRIALQYALPVTRILARACNKGIVGVIAPEFLYDEI